ncbi:uncharacterized protein LOC122498241 [Leptopilina heterotoma]|uniref:uncharacterized protein LOC122498241 n=1 Tax=Leptopilina heterotoma TaxID=63436 RepID=UPI001CA9A5FF|nr:uncharacterized protein LOC122498241 [Leptopilina heterotoma]
MSLLLYPLGLYYLLAPSSENSKNNNSHKILMSTVQVVNVTNTTCNIFWNKPIDGDENLSYDIVVIKDGENLTAFSHTTSDTEISFRIPYLEPGSKYKIIVISKIDNKEITKNSTDCITMPEIDVPKNHSSCLNR